MTKKDYIKLAKVISNTTAVANDLDQQGIPHNRYISKLCFINELCQILEEDNPRFDRDLFLEACNS